jgi:hypothetical protein
MAFATLLYRSVFVNFTAQEWIMLIAAITTAVVAIVGAFKANTAASAAVKAAAVADQTHAAVNGITHELIAAKGIIAQAKGRSEGVIAGQAGELPPIPKG